MKKLTLGSLFDGSGSFPLAGMINGIEPTFASEVEPFPIRVTEKRLPNMEHFGDVSKLKGGEIEPVDIITFGSPCQDMSLAGKRKGMKHSLNGDEDTTRSGLFFDAIRIIEEMREATNGEKPRYALWENVCFDKNTLITTQNGFVPINNVCVGDLVKTHTGEFKRVLNVIETPNKETLIVRFQGAEPLTVTPNHPFLTRRMIKDDKGKITFDEPQWKAVANINDNDFVGFRIDGFGNKSIGLANAYAVGRWLADGSVVIRNRKQKHRIFISTGYKKHEALKEELLKLPYPIRENKMSHAVNFTFTSDEFYELIKECGKGARQKKVPQYVFELVEEEQKEVLRGYLEGDGFLRRENQWCFSTSSRELAYGLARLVRNVYRVGTSMKKTNGKGTVQIEDRTVNAHDFWTCYFSEPNEKSRYSGGSKYCDGFVWCHLKEKCVGKPTTVYNLSVDTNNTYEANGITVHNCGALSSSNGEDFRRVLEELSQIKDINAEIPKMDKWPNAGEVDGKDYSIAWRMLDAQYFGVPQRRKRIYLLADFNGQNAGKIMFESEGKSFFNKEHQKVWRELQAEGTAEDIIKEYNKQLEK